MPDYLTRVVMAGARTGDGRVRPVRVTAALPPTSMAAASAPSVLPVADEAVELTIDAPSLPAPVSPSRVGRNVDVAAVPHATAHATDAVPPANVVAEPSAGDPPNEPRRAEARVDVTSEPPAVARLFAPHTETHVVRMPRSIRAFVPQPAPPGEGPAPGGREPASIIAAHEGLVNVTDVRETLLAMPRAPHAEAAVPAIKFERVAAEDRPRPVAADVAKPRPVPPRIESAFGSSDVATAPRTESPRRRVTIGRLELQVQHVAPPQLPAPMVRPPRLPAAPASAIEGHFLDGLRWKL